MKLVKPQFSWPHAKKDLEDRLNLSRSEQDFSDLMEEIGSIIKSCDLDSEEKIDARNFKQKVYDRKKRFPKDVVSLNNTYNVQDFKDDNKDEKYLTNLLQDFDIFIVAKRVFAFSVFFICTFLTSLFIFKQSIPIYEAVGFPEPMLCSIGALVMIIGFSAIYSLKKSKFLLLLCIYMSAYEVILIVKGTFIDDSAQLVTAIDKSPELKFAQEKVNHAEELYKTVKAQYDTPGSNVFHNSWYKEKYVTPYWGVYEAAQSDFLKKKKELHENPTSSKNESFLKILFRLGLVFLCMISVHNTLRIVLEFIDSKISQIHEKK